MTTVLVTGGAGNIGSFLVDQLVARGHYPVVVDNFYNSSPRYLEPHVSSRRAALEVCDITDYAALSRIFAQYQPELASHQASMMIMDSDKLPFAALQVNIVGTFNFIQCCLAHGVRRITFASSASVFGDPHSVPVDESHPYDNRTLYGATKIAAEHLFQSWAYSHGLPWVGFRYYNTYSERQGIGALYTQLFQKWILAIAKDEPISIYGDGEQTMDLLHAEDAARANVLALLDSDVQYEMFNVGTGVETSVNQLKTMLFSAMGKDVPVEYLPYDAHLVRRRVASTEKIRTLLGFAARIGLDEGIRRYLDALQPS